MKINGISPADEFKPLTLALARATSAIERQLNTSKPDVLLDIINHHNERVTEYWTSLFDSTYYEK